MINLRFIGTGGLGSARIKNKLSKDYRRFSTLLIDDRILIDPSEDIFEFEESFMLGGMYKKVKDVFISNSNLDHFSICAIEKLGKVCGKIRVYATKAVGNELCGIENVDFIEINPYSLIKLDGIGILSLPANHKTEVSDEIALNFLVDCGEKTLFYGLDGAMIDPGAWQILKEVKLDVAILECALANEDFSGACFNHNNLAMIITLKDIMMRAGVATETTKFILSHIPTSRKTSIHEELCEKTADENIKIAYDGYFLGI